MDKKVLKIINDSINPICEKYKGAIKSIYLAGSAVRKDYVPGSDIDILIIVDDTCDNFDARVLNLINSDFRDVSKKAMLEHKLDLHIQDAKTLSVFWDMVRSGQPWIITQMRDAYVLYDPSGYISPIKTLLNAGKLSGTKERAQTLINDAPKKLVDARKIFLNEVMSDLLLAMVESSQAVLMFSGVAPPASKNIGRELSLKFVNTKIIPKKIVNDYEQIYELTKKIDHGEVSHVSGKEIERYLGMVIEFIEGMEKLFNVLDFMKKKKMVNSAYEKSIDACRIALKKINKVEPKTNTDLLKHFKVHFVDTGLVSKDHLEVLKKMHSNKKAFDSGKVSDISENEIYSSNVYAQNLENAIGDVKLGNKAKSKPKRVAKGKN